LTSKTDKKKIDLQFVLLENRFSFITKKNMNDKLMNQQNPF